MSEEETVQEIITSLEVLQQSEQLSEQTTRAVQEIISVLQEDIDVELRVDKIQEILASLDQSQNLSMQVRTQLWAVNSMLKLL